ncbi:MAG: hypothetical protein GY945_00310 [Rhodobacteraceae bacterium]|nr:hypothetical protein [Paracoccaceae bacterium]
MIEYHSPIGQAAYDDLKRLCRDEQVTDIKGTPAKKTVKGKGYWYDRFRIGTDWSETYLGEDGPELAMRIERHLEIKAEKDQRRAERIRLIRLLRAEGYTRIDAQTGSLLSAMEKVGVFRLGGTIIGSVAFSHYEAELGVRYRLDHLARTDDLDIASFEALSLAIGDHVAEPVQEVLARFKFSPVPGLDSHRVWRWKQAGRETLVEFLMPAQRDEGVRDLPALGVSARALRHLDFLLADPIHAVSLYRTGILVQVPRPEAYAVHKLIVADRRRDGPNSAKARKDREQAGFLIEALAQDRPDELAESYLDARDKGPKWRQRLDATLARMPETRSLLDRV